MHDLAWSAAEKKIARRAYEEAVEAALSKLVIDFKARAAAATTPADVWAIQDYLSQKRGEFDEMFDYRYSQLIFVFARLIREGHLDEARLHGLSEEKLQMIRRLVSL
jgi:hypothetical protein